MTIRLVISDVDGVLTDGGVYVDAEGREFCRYSRRDGQAVADMRRLGVSLLLVSNDANVHRSRAAKLGVQLVDGFPYASRLAAAMSIASVPLSEVCYVGDSWTDVEALEAVAKAGGSAVVPLDSEADRMMRPYMLREDPQRGRVRSIGGEGVLADVRDALFDGPWRRRA